MAFHTFEDRPGAQVGVRLLTLSFMRHLPNEHLTVWGVSPQSEFAQWISTKSRIKIGPALPSNVTGWNVKPSILAAALSRDGSPCYWIDSDVIFTGDIRPVLASVPISHFVATEEPRSAEAPQGSDVRIPDFDLKRGRSLDRTVNSCFMRVAPEHLPLLDKWRELLADGRYQAAQCQPYSERPVGLCGDQDVLTALLGSEQFKLIPVHLLRAGEDVAQCMHSLGYGVMDRLGALIWGMPALIHAQGEKPWDPRPALSTQLSPYSAVAREYRRHLEADFSLDWLEPKAPVAKILDRITLGHPVLRGFPLTLIRSIHEKMAKRKTASPSGTDCP